MEAGWVPRRTRMDELESAIRAVCEPYFTRPLSEISLAEVVIKLFQVARRHELPLLEVRIASADLRTLADNSQRNARIAVCLGLGVVSALGAVALQRFDTHAPRLAGCSSAAIVLALAAAWAFIAALRSR